MQARPVESDEVGVPAGTIGDGHRQEKHEYDAEKDFLPFGPAAAGGLPRDVGCCHRLGAGERQIVCACSDR
ncbi:hypothetical protein D3C86_2129840 [compost metagenome]